MFKGLNPLESDLCPLAYLVKRQRDRLPHDPHEAGLCPLIRTSGQSRDTFCLRVLGLRLIFLRCYRLAALQINGLQAASHIPPPHYVLAASCSPPGMLAFLRRVATVLSTIVFDYYFIAATTCRAGPADLGTLGLYVPRNAHAYCMFIASAPEYRASGSRAASHLQNSAPASRRNQLDHMLKRVLSHMELVKATRDSFTVRRAHGSLSRSLK